MIKRETGIVTLVEPEEATSYQRWQLPVMDGRAINADEIDKKKRDKQVEVISEEEIEPEEIPDLPSPEELQQIRDDAYKEGFDQGKEAGYQKGLKIAQKEYKQLSGECKNLLIALAEPLNVFDDQAEQQLLRLSISIARHIIRRELMIDPNQVVAVIKESIKLLPSYCQTIHVYVHPADALILKDIFHLEVHENTNWHVFEDPSLERGGCRIISENSRVEADIESRLAQITAKLLGDQREPNQIDNENDDRTKPSSQSYPF